MVEDERLSMKRKGIDQVNDEFSDFSLTSPARKIRRLDVDLPPIREEDMAMQETESEETEPNPVNEERSIVLFKPLLHHQPSSSGQLFVDRDLISDFKNRFFRGASRAVDNNDEDEKSNKCQAVVCWNPSISPYSEPIGTFQQPRRTLEIVELDETCEDAVMDEAAMEIEEDNRSSTGLSFPQQEDPTYGFGLHQWQQHQQQHCMVPPLPQVNTTPVTWFR
ncbi:unnamed protein product [Microthlaspi erraticum]|uniref:Uncharacterized protein n=1 Tax=Microthlaspi erraticum TaxID=1685480 RepID=A0A6D2I3Q3_9BRAS|nr:unnamed protein product [Microthlaspi erraticum]